jgi:S-adenosylmethionine decarboxylase
MPKELSLHLLIDGSFGDINKMYNQDALTSFLREYPSTLGMNIIYGPVVLPYSAPNPLDSGISGFVVIAESHISVHTFPEHNYINIDIFSCRSFDSDKAISDIKAFFSLQTIKSWLVERGLEYLDQNPDGPNNTNQLDAAVNTN